MSFSCQNKSDKTKKLGSCLCILIATAAVALCIWRSGYGFSDDEPFYYSMTLRFLQGDAFFADEWNTSQMSGVLLSPFVYLYMLINGSATGIMVFARFVYIFLHFLVCAFVFYRFRSKGFVAFAAALSYFLFQPHEIMAYYYNTMAIDFMVLCICIILGGAEKQAMSGLRAYISGVVFAAAVLSYPYLACAYFLLAAYILFFSKKKKLSVLDSAFLWRFTLGCATLALPFFVLVFSRTNPTEITSALPFIFNDPENPPLSLWDRGVTIFYSTVFCHPLFRYALLAYAVVLLGIGFDRNRKSHRALYLSLSLLICLFCYAIFLEKAAEKYYNAIMLPLIFPGFVAFLLLESKSWLNFALFFIQSLLFALCIFFSSNLFFLVVPMATAVANIGSVFFIFALIEELLADISSHSTPPILLAWLCLIALITMQFYTKANHCYYQFERPAELTYYLSEGPAKGTYTDDVKGENYTGVIEDLKMLDLEEGKIAYLTNAPWLYLCTPQLRCATYSSWFAGETEFSLDRLETYWSLDAERKADYIYVPKYSAFDKAKLIGRFEALGYEFSELPNGYFAELGK